MRTTQRTDLRGLAVTANSSEAVAAIDRFTDAAIALKPGMDAILAAADTDRECAMLQACAAALFALSQSSAQARRAEPYMARARERMDDLTERERLFVEAVSAGCAGDFVSAIELYERIAARWPRDLLAAKIAEFHFFETGLAARQLEFMEKIAPANSDSSHAQAMLAFACELNALRPRAEAIAIRALEQDPLTMWAQHCLAHVWAGDSRIADGIAAMQSFAPTWNRFGQYIQSHNTFHLATLYRTELDFDRVLDAYRRHIWGFQPDAVVEHTDAILLLWYVELAGGDAGGRWREIAPRIRARAHEQVFPFLSAIYLFALERGGEPAEVDRALDEIRRHAERQSGNAARVWNHGLEQARGCVAYARGDYDLAADTLGAILPEIAIGGGSDEQRGVFHESHFMSLIKAGRGSEAADALANYAGAGPRTKLDRRWFELAVG
ncbi:MAG: tetratricopeptide repeat protein [Candidatus Binataceae bacterium]